jgi:hypothetical protein
MTRAFDEQISVRTTVEIYRAFPAHPLRLLRGKLPLERRPRLVRVSFGRALGTCAKARPGRQRRSGGLAGPCRRSAPAVFRFQHRGENR